MISDVHIRECSDYDDARVRNNVRDILLNMGAEDQIKNANILVKPNLLQAVSPDKCATTHPAVIKAVIKSLLELGASEILIGDNPAFIGTKEFKAYQRVLQVTGVEEIAKFSKVRLVFLNEGTDLAGWLVSKIATEIDLILNLPKFKCHGLTGISCATKNIFGLIPGLQKQELHRKNTDPDKFSGKLTELCALFPRQIVLVDAINILDGEGSISRKPIATKTIMGGYNPSLVDLSICKLFRIKTEKIPMWRAIRSICSDEPIINGGLKQFPSLEIVRHRCYPLSLADFKSDASFPSIEKKYCKGCGMCVLACPFGAIEGDAENAWINKQQCRKCCCCVEVCKHGAIKSTSI